eukprot:CAMPEP_0170941282 /NCGR_PEP_ID=MMETSP0735-20130129/23324_1 /TAXON_ID=186038 /ORGANISM="Fragilariopsis kerguelensis, Strain L26-C5" /LENGTH=60 /DNA_ID=CAMNT_0011347599 /DNA_START=395 /DNA_END=574 /DNA_ORIENTATION=+
MTSCDLSGIFSFEPNLDWNLEIGMLKFIPFSLPTSHTTNDGSGGTDIERTGRRSNGSRDT